MLCGVCPQVTLRLSILAKPSVDTRCLAKKKPHDVSTIRLFELYDDTELIRATV